MLEEVPVVEEQIVDRKELEFRIFYSVIVAGKSAKFTNDVVHRWSKLFIEDEESPFDAMRRLERVDALLWSFQQARTGNYGKLFSAMSDLIHRDLDLETCSPDDLEQIKGIGPKTSRFFIMWTRPDAQYAALDVHILRWLSKRHQGIPKATPQNRKRYRALELIFLDEARFLGRTPRELDLIVWSEASSHPNITHQ